MLTVQELTDILTASHCLDFLRAEAEEAVKEIVSGSEGASGLLVPEAKAALADQYFARLFLLYFEPFVQKLKEALRAYDLCESLTLSGGNPEAVRKAASDVCRANGKDPKQVLQREYPLLDETVIPMRRNFISAQIEMMRHILKYKKEIEETLLDGMPFSEILDFSADSGDMHRHGRAVRRVAVDTGVFFYKPHDCRTDALYGEIIRRWFSDCTRSPRIVCGEGCGFAQEMKPEPLSDGQTPGDYFRHFGMLTALFHGLGAGDMNYENILACGCFPTAVDLEMIFRPRREKPGETEDRGLRHPTPLQLDLQNSVTHTAVLPIWIHPTGMHSPLYTSRGFSGAACLPVLSGREHTVSGSEQEFVSGFHLGYARVLAHREEILCLAEQFGEAPVRHVMKNTAWYFILRRELFRYGCTSGKAARQKILDKLEVAYAEEGNPVPRAVIEYERRCLLQGDIPYYCVRADGHDLCGEDCSETLVPGFWGKSALEALRERLNRLSGDERRFEEEWILSSLRHAPLSEKTDGIVLKKADTPLTSAEARMLLTEMLKDLAEDRVEGCRGEKIWFSVTRMIWPEASCGMVSRMADAALFCTSVQKVLPEELNPMREEIIRGFLTEMRCTLDGWQRERPETLRRVLPLNGRTGLAALLRTLNSLQADGSGDAEDLLNELIEWIDRCMLFHDDVKAGGEAGLLLALSELKSVRLHDPDVWIRCIRRCAESLRQHEAFPRIDDNARFALAMEKSCQITGSPEYLPLAENAWSEIRKAYLPKEGWHDTFAGNWLSPVGNNTAQIGLYALLSKETSGGVADLALQSQMAEAKLRTNDSLIEGNAMAVLFLIRFAEMSGRTELLEEAGRILRGMNRRKDQYGAFRCTPENVRSSFDGSLWRGALGIGIAAVAYLCAVEEEEHHGKD